ncbi:MAG TPA: extracellular solute-binding protein [Candidatus Binatia bacterium]|nr:extracellular solute-binding protein [Candidatus Binatia bacterium]
MKILAAALLFVFLTNTPASSQSGKPSSPAEIAAYSGPDRERLLMEGAKREGKLVWYTTLAVVQNKQIAATFESKYPGVKVEIYRTGSSALVQRVLNEAQARRHIADAIETTLPGLMTFRDNQLLLPYTSPYLPSFPQESKEKGPANLVYWTTDRESYLGFAYNKNLLVAADVPKNFDGLLKPALRDQLGISGDDSGARSIGAMVKVKGEEFVRNLKQQNIKAYMMAGSALTQLVAAGEVPGSPSQFYSATHVAAKKGAPVAWVPMDINVVGAGGAAVYANAQRPHAALLFVDFLLSAEGQKLLEDLDFGSARKDYGFKRWYPEKEGTLAQYEQALERWHQLLKEIIRK